MPPFSAESATKEGVAGIKQAQRAGLIYVLSMITVVLDHQLSALDPKAPDAHLNQDLLSAVHILIEFWISHWDQVWGMIRLEEKWTGLSGDADSHSGALPLIFLSLLSMLFTRRSQNT